VLPGEEQRGPLAVEVLLELRRGPIELGGQLGIGRFLDQLEVREQVVDPRLEPTPELDLGSQAIGLAEDLLGAALVVPEAGLAGQRLELGDPALFRLEVKDAPRST
jgi:hypothetical protein